MHVHTIGSYSLAREAMKAASLRRRETTHVAVLLAELLDLIRRRRGQRPLLRLRPVEEPALEVLQAGDLRLLQRV